MAPVCLGHLQRCLPPCRGAKVAEEVSLPPAYLPPELSPAKLSPFFHQQLPLEWAGTWVGFCFLSVLAGWLGQLV